MSSFDGGKRQRTDECHTSSPISAPSDTDIVEPGSGAVVDSRRAIGADSEAGFALVSAANSVEPFPIHELLERLLAKQDRIAADVAHLQSTIDSVLTTLRHQSAPQRTALQYQQQQPERRPFSTAPLDTRQRSPLHTWTGGHASSTVPPTLTNIVSLRDEPSSLLSSMPATQGATLGPPTSPSATSAAESASPRAQGLQYGTASNVRDDITANDPESSYNIGGGDSRLVSHPHYANELYQPRSRNPATNVYSTPPPPSTAARTARAGGLVPSVRSPPSLLIQGQSRGQQQQQQQQHSTSASSSSAPTQQFSSVRTAHPSLQQQQQQQRLSGLSLAPTPYQQQTSQQYAAHQAASSSPRVHPHHPHHHSQHAEHPMSLPPIRTSSSAAHPYAGHPRSSISQRTSAASASPYSSTTSLASAMFAGATHAAPKPLHSHNQSPLPSISGLTRTLPSTAGGAAARTPTPNVGGSPTGSNVGPLGVRGNATPSGGRSYSGSQSGGGGGDGSGAMSQQKVEKNRFQANIRAFVDHHFIAHPGAQWDYQQSFKAPRNAQATHHIVQAFHASYGGTYERIEHGLGVYFSSLKAKHRTTDDKAMLKQQRDRRRARRIKKAAGRRKVFDQAQYPFLPPDFDTQQCFVPSVMSPEHTDEEGEVKVGGLPWRASTFNKLFRHLDTLRPKRTPRPTDPSLSGGILPPPDVPAFMLDMEYMAVDRSYHHDPEADIEMESSSDDAGSRHGSDVYM